MSNYEEYTLIENHVHISRTLYELDRRARLFIAEMERRKGIHGRKQYERDVQDMLSILHSLSKPKLLNHNLFSSLHYYLDDMMFSEVSEVYFFMVEDEKYPVSAIYFDKERWMDEKWLPVPDIQHVPGITAAEGAHLLLFFSEYETLVRELEVKVGGMKDSKVKTKLKRILTRIKKRYLKGMGIAADKIIQEVKKKIETYQPVVVPSSTS